MIRVAAAPAADHPLRASARARTHTQERKKESTHPPTTHNNKNQILIANNHNNRCNA
jgi:hypothetical protein